MLSLVLLGAACTETNSTNGQTGTTTNTGTPGTSTSAEVNELTSDLISETGINFSNKNQQQMRWNIVEEKSLNGQVFTAQNISYQDLTKIEEYLRSQGFEPDSVNTSVNGKTVTIGYSKDNTICKVQGEVLGNLQPADQNALQNARFNVKAGCGSL